MGLPVKGILNKTLPDFAMVDVPVGIGELIIEPPLYATIVKLPLEI